MKIKTDDNQPIDDVDSLTYLGSFMDADKGSTADISARLKKARAAHYKLRKVWASSQYRRKTKLRIYKSNVMSILLYRAECWKLYEKVEISRITGTIKARRWSFISHILRFENTNDCRKVMNWTPFGKRSIGRPKETWRRMVEKERDA